MTVSFESNAALLQTMHQVKAHTIPFSSGFLHRPQNFAHISANRKTQI